MSRGLAPQVASRTQERARSIKGISESLSRPRQLKVCKIIKEAVATVVLLEYEIKALITWLRKLERV